MNRTRIHWLGESRISKGCMFIEAVPGVGNVGKILVDGLMSKHPSRTIGWILNPDFPPHATLSDNGLIYPPRLDINTVMLPDGSEVIIITGLMQPMTASGQYETAEAILGLAKDYSASRLLVLAGLAADPECRSIHAICSSNEVRRKLEDDDIEVSRKQPKQGMIGIAGMVLSLSATMALPAIGVIAETIGASSDVLAADRMAKWIEHAFEVPLDLDLDTTKETAKKLVEGMVGDDSLEDLLGSKEQDSTADFYV